MFSFDLVETKDYFLRGQMAEGLMFLHLDFLASKFNKSTYMSMLDDWEEILHTLKEKGITEVFSCVKKEDGKVCKWQRMFGMSPHKETEDVMIFRREL